jgi:hypothetical protein
MESHRSECFPADLELLTLRAADLSGDFPAHCSVRRANRSVSGRRWADALLSDAGDAALTGAAMLKVHSLVRVRTPATVCLYTAKTVRLHSSGCGRCADTSQLTCRASSQASLGQTCLAVPFVRQVERQRSCCSIMNEESSQELESPHPHPLTGSTRCTSSASSLLDGTKSWPLQAPITQNHGTHKAFSCPSSARDRISMTEMSSGTSPGSKSSCPKTTQQSPPYQQEGISPRNAAIAGTGSRVKCHQVRMVEGNSDLKRSAAICPLSCR